MAEITIQSESRLMYRVLIILFLAVVLFSNCYSPSPFVMGSNYDPAFDRQKLENMSIVFHYVDDSDEKFWNHKSSKDKTPLSMEAELYNDLAKSFSEDGINVLDARLDSESTQWDEVREEADVIKQYLTDLNNAGSLTFSFQTSYDYNSLVDDSNSEYAMVIVTDPYSVENTHTSVGGFYADGTMMPSTSSRTTTYEYGVFAYIVDLEINKVVWVFNNHEYVDLYTFDYTIPQRTALAAILLGRDLTYSSFELHSDNNLRIIEHSGNDFLGKITTVNGLKINIETRDSTFNRHLREILEIKTERANSYGETVGRTLYPKYLK